MVMVILFVQQGMWTPVAKTELSFIFVTAGQLGRLQKWHYLSHLRSKRERTPDIQQCAEKCLFT